MNAGKSTYLLQIAHNYNENGMPVFLLTAELDDRYGNGAISSRIGLHREAETFNANTDFEKRLAPVHAACVLVDEAQFLTRNFAASLAIHGGVRANSPAGCNGISSYT